MTYQVHLFSEEDFFRSTDNRGLESLPEGKALPFVKWAGGKRSITDKINIHLPTNIETYYEPFVGGGAVFFTFQHKIQRATLSDLNPVLILAYLAVRNNIETLIESLEEHARADRQHRKTRFSRRDVGGQEFSEMLPGIAKMRLDRAFGLFQA